MPGTRYNFPFTTKPGGPLVVEIDDNPANFPSAGMIGSATAPSVVLPTDHPEYSSVIAAVILGGAPSYRMVDGVLMNLLTNQPVPAEPQESVPQKLPRGLADLQQWQVDHSYFHNQNYVDGQGPENKQGYQGDDSLPGVYWQSNADGSWTLRKDAGAAPPVPPVTVVPEVKAGEPTIIELDSLKGQHIYRFPGAFIARLTNLQAPSKAGNLLRLRVFPQAGGETDPGDVTVVAGGQTLTRNAVEQWLVAVGASLEATAITEPVGGAVKLSCLSPRNAPALEVTSAAI